jgi:hypothetical protein
MSVKMRRRKRKVVAAVDAALMTPTYHQSAAKRLPA